MPESPRWLASTGRVKKADAVVSIVFASVAYAILQTISFSLYLYSAELHPTRLRAIGTGFGSAWLRAGSAIAPRPRRTLALTNPTNTHNHKTAAAQARTQD